MPHAPRKDPKGSLTNDILDFLSQRKDPLLGTNEEDFKKAERFRDLPSDDLEREIICLAFANKVFLRVAPTGKWRAWIPDFVNSDTFAFPARIYGPPLDRPLEQTDWKGTLLKVIIQTGSHGVNNDLLDRLYWRRLETERPDLENKTAEFIHLTLAKLRNVLVQDPAGNWIHIANLKDFPSDQLSSVLALTPLSRLIFTELLIKASEEGLTSEAISTWAKEKLLLTRPDHLEVAWALKSLKDAKFIHSTPSGQNYPNQRPIKTWKLGPPPQGELADDRDEEEDFSSSPLPSTVNVTISLNLHFENILGLSVKLKGSNTYLPIALPPNASVKLYADATGPDNPSRLVIWNNVEELVISTPKFEDEKHFLIQGQLGIQID